MQPFVVCVPQSTFFLQPALDAHLGLFTVAGQFLTLSMERWILLNQSKHYNLVM